MTYSGVRLPSVVASTMATLFLAAMLGASAHGNQADSASMTSVVRPDKAASVVRAPTTEGPATTRPTPTRPAPTGPTSPTGPTAPTPTKPTPPTKPTARSVPTFVDASGFNDHTVPRIKTISELNALLRVNDTGQAAVKFVIPYLHEPNHRDPSFDGSTVRWMDSNFYQLHDEWYWFRLMNNQPIPGAPTTPFSGPTFGTIAEIYRWAQARGQAPLPLDLRWVGEGGERRLYSPKFYEYALTEGTRTFGVGSLVRFPDPSPAKREHWLLSLEYPDSATPSEVSSYFQHLESTLPPDVAKRLQWVVRSPSHEATAKQMIAGKLPYFDRVVYFKDLVPTGTVDVYSEGVAAGRLLFVGEKGAQFSDARAGGSFTDAVPAVIPTHQQRTFHLANSIRTACDCR